MNGHQMICQQFGQILKGEGKFENGVCSVSLKRNFPVMVMGRPSKGFLLANVLFESLDEKGNALNIGEVAILEEEVYAFNRALVQQGIIVSALHNHWIFIQPNLLYIHFQSVEPPLNFAEKVAYAYSTLTSYPAM
ncbi:DUF1259 domain-containing protein [Paenibacillus sp. RU4T]|uniref:DUF1259 domain-containing protein n=1 Tax=Paenibacillus sp. RU4T TaxID=1907394 RepID=UPI0009556053|nr:DUF1259 domain-containing protein [Paenibacillus sp. RUD330]SIQ24552.1 protein of unknown function [Paenibacillus sp. RU4X]